MTTITPDFALGVKCGVFRATGRATEMPTDPTEEFVTGWLRGFASVESQRTLKASAATTVQPEPVQAVPENPTIGERFVLPIAKGETNSLLVAVCDRCWASLDCSGEPFLRATFGEQSLAVCGACGGSLEVIVIDDKLTAFKD